MFGPAGWHMPPSDTPQVRIAAERDRGEWDRFVDAHDDGAGYHSWAWREVFERAFGHESIYLIAAGRDGAITGVLPMVLIKSLLFGRTLTSLPFLNYGGVLTDSDEVALALVEASKGAARDHRCSHVELRHTGARFPHLPCKQHKVSMRMDLQPGIWDRMDRKARNQVRKAQKSGLTVERGGAALLPDFYTVFARNMRDLGTPVYSRRLFEEVVRAFPDRTCVHVVRLNGAPVASGITYRTPKMTQLPWASSIRDFNALCPNHLLYWDAIEHAAEVGCPVLDLGRSTPGEGTFKFKEQWGARPLPLHWEYQLLSADQVPNVSPANPKFQLAIALWQKLPLSVTLRVGPMIVRAIP